jgi:hypothetical protein
MDCALNVGRCRRWAGCSRHAENSGQHAFWSEAFFNQAAHLGFQKAVRQIRIREGGHDPLELSQATCDFAGKLGSSFFHVGLGWHGRIETWDCALASFIVVRVKAPRDPRLIYGWMLLPVRAR